MLLNEHGSTSTSKFLRIFISMDSQWMCCPHIPSAGFSLVPGYLQQTTLMALRSFIQQHSGLLGARNLNWLRQCIVVAA